MFCLLRFPKRKDESSNRRNMSKGTSLLLLLVGVALAFGCAAPALKFLHPGAAPPPIHELWQPPADVSIRDLFNGVGGAELAPPSNSRFQFVEEDTTGASPGYTARDENGTEWDIKLGDEVQPEVVLSRLLWAVGFHQPAAPTLQGLYGVYVTNEVSGDLSVIDPATHTTIATVPLGKRPRGIRVSPDRAQLFIALSGSPISPPGIDESKLPPPDRT